MTDATERIPPGPALTRHWPVLHHGTVPRIELETWRFRIFGLGSRTTSCCPFISPERLAYFALFDYHHMYRWVDENQTNSYGGPPR
jgi:hypothetical protein